ncbi:MAG: hypothetical protein DBY24_10445 [Prevotellaceae bacterium]|nr:MAG: hypothetical protein DBY24_10445 [Prevotellaceae bacterium]
MRLELIYPSKVVLRPQRFTIKLLTVHFQRECLYTALPVRPNARRREGNKLNGFFHQKKQDIQEYREYKDSPKEKNQENGNKGDLRTEEQKRQPEIGKQENGRGKAEKNPAGEREPGAKPVKHPHSSFYIQTTNAHKPDNTQESRTLQVAIESHPNAQTKYSKGAHLRLKQKCQNQQHTSQRKNRQDHSQKLIHRLQEHYCI